jgi:hypothetical protein
MESKIPWTTGPAWRTANEAWVPASGHPDTIEGGRADHDIRCPTDQHRADRPNREAFRLIR